MAGLVVVVVVLVSRNGRFCRVRSRSNWPGRSRLAIPSRDHTPQSCGSDKSQHNDYAHYQEPAFWFAGRTAVHQLVDACN